MVSREEAIQGSRYYSWRGEGNTCVVMHQLGEGAYQQELRVSCQAYSHWAASRRLKYIIINDDDDDRQQRQ